MFWVAVYKCLVDIHEQRALQVPVMAVQGRFFRGKKEMWAEIELNDYLQ